MASSDELVDTNWGWKDNSLATITAAAAQVSAREAKKQTATLQEIRGLLLDLGRDGIHHVIRRQRTLAHRAIKAERTKRRNAREAAKART